MIEEETSPYHIALQKGTYQVLGKTDAIICNCGDQANAQHYAALLNEAYKQGYQSGYRTGKKSVSHHSSISDNAKPKN